jgi:hypothetical protein
MGGIRTPDLERPQDVDRFRRPLATAPSRDFGILLKKNAGLISFVPWQACIAGLPCVAATFFGTVNERPEPDPEPRSSLDQARLSDDW